MYHLYWFHDRYVNKVWFGAVFSCHCAARSPIVKFHLAGIYLALAMVLVGSLQLSYHLGPWRNYLHEENLKVQKLSPLPSDNMKVSGKYMCFNVSVCSYTKTWLFFTVYIPELWHPASECSQFIISFGKFFKHFG